MQNVSEIGKLCRERGIFFHTDGAQAVGKIPIDVDKMNIDLMSISGHKIYGPKGVGALYVRRKPRVRLAPLFSGGGQERGFRSGTVPANLVVGLGRACEIALREMESDQKHVQRLYKRLMDGIKKNLTHFQVNGDEIQRYLGNANISFACI